MNLYYLRNDILPQRDIEIENRKNQGTSNPLYFVYQLDEHITSGHSDYTLTCNNINKPSEFGYIDRSLDWEEREFQESDRYMLDPEAVTRFWSSRFTAFFLTYEAANDYLQYQKHNLTNPYIYVEYPGYANRQMNALFSSDKDVEDLMNEYMKVARLDLPSRTNE